MSWPAEMRNSQIIANYSRISDWRSTNAKGFC